MFQKLLRPYQMVASSFVRDDLERSEIKKKRIRD
jgi:hypothetical protein